MIRQRVKAALFAYTLQQVSEQLKWLRMWVESAYANLHA